MSRASSAGIWRGVELHPLRHVLFQPQHKYEPPASLLRHTTHESTIEQSNESKYSTSALANSGARIEFGTMRQVCWDNEEFLERYHHASEVNPPLWHLHFVRYHNEGTGFRL